MRKSIFINAVLASSLFVAFGATEMPAKQNTNPRNNWGIEALGPDVPKPEWKPAPIRHELKTRFKSLPSSGEPLAFVKSGQPAAVLTLAQNANSSSKAAAEVLQSALQKMSGAQLPIVLEDNVQAHESTFVAEGKNYEYLISIGETKFARSANVSADDLDLDGYRLKTQGKVLFLVGRDKEPFADTAGRPLPEGATNTRFLQANGTRNGAYALLERHFGWRFLWPEEGNGTVFSKQETIVLQPLNESDEPAMAARGIRNYYPELGQNASARRHHQQTLPLLSRTYSEFLKKANRSGAWFDAMKLGTSVEYNVGHSFTSYWQQYGESHPEWFALQADGTRDVERWYKDTGGRAQLDVSNPELIQHVANEAIAKFDADPELTSFSIAPNDGSYPSFCLCEVCRRLDPPQGEPISFSIVNKEGKASRITYPSLSDRYVLFYSGIADKVAEKHPDKLLGAYAYSVYSSPPHYAKLSPNVFISYVGLSYFNEAQRQRDKQSWDTWAAAGGQMLLRPNALLGLYGIPASFTHKLAEDVKHAYQTGMIGTDFDALTHDWAGRGLDYYVLAKLLWDPAQDVDKLIKDYCDTGFGSASSQIQKYFAELEALTNEIAENTGDAARTEDGIDNVAMATSLRIMLRSYTPERIETLQSILDQAKEQTTDSDILERINFLEQGLRYARVETDALRAHFHGKNNLERVKTALAERKRVFVDIYDNHFYAQSVFPTLYRTASLWRTYGLDGLGGELKQ